MPVNFTVRRDPIRGQRVNATPESDIPDVVKLAVQAAKKQQNAIRRSRVLSVIGSVFLLLTWIIPAVFFIHSAANGQAMPLLLYPILVVAFRYSTNLGGLLLYLASRAANKFRKLIGWNALASFLLPIAAFIVTGEFIFTLDPADLSRTSGLIAGILILITLLSMLALNVLSVLLLIQVFHKPDKKTTA